MLLSRRYEALDLCRDQRNQTIPRLTRTAQSISYATARKVLNLPDVLTLPDSPDEIWIQLRLNEWRWLHGELVFQTDEFWLYKNLKLKTTVPVLYKRINQVKQASHVKSRYRRH